jgi:hypothetical protein
LYRWLTAGALNARPDHNKCAWLKSAIYGGMRRASGDDRYPGYISTHPGRYTIMTAAENIDPIGAIYTS